MGHNLASLEGRAEALKVASQQKDHPSQKRLSRLLQACREQSKFLKKILAPFDVDHHHALVNHVAMRSRLPKSQGLMSYYDNVFRDWVWGDQENQTAFEIVSSLMGDSRGGDMLVLGAGACRLPIDLHQAGLGQTTIAADINPLLFLICQKLIAGRKVDLYEFPLAPKSSNDAAVHHKISWSGDLKPGFHQVLTDAFHPGLKTGVFDVVVTPWFVDIVHQDLKVTANHINQLLKPGGLWINYGSLAFFHADETKCYAREEVPEVIKLEGFGDVTTRADQHSYLDSPHSCQTRIEEVFSFRAVKTGVAARATHREYLPPWLINLRQPVPKIPEFQQILASNHLLIQVISMIDGQRNLADLGKLTAPIFNLQEAAASELVRQLLKDLYENQLKNASWRA